MKRTLLIINKNRLNQQNFKLLTRRVQGKRDLDAMRRDEFPHALRRKDLTENGSDVEWSSAAGNGDRVQVIDLKYSWETRFLSVPAWVSRSHAFVFCLSPSIGSMPSKVSRCRYCQKTVPTPGAIKRHISHAPVCFKAWQEELTSKNTLHLFDDNLQAGNCREVDKNPSDVEMDDFDMGIGIEPEIGDPSAYFGRQ